MSTRCRARPGRVPGHLEQKGPRRLELHTTSKPLSLGVCLLNIESGSDWSPWTPPTPSRIRRQVSPQPLFKPQLLRVGRRDELQS